MENINGSVIACSSVRSLWGVNKSYHPVQNLSVSHAHPLHETISPCLFKHQSLMTQNMGEWRYTLINALIISALDGGEWSASCPCHFISVVRSPGADYISSRTVCMPQMKNLLPLAHVLIELPTLSTWRDVLRNTTSYNEANLSKEDKNWQRKHWSINQSERMVTQMQSLQTVLLE